jgi:hypothetical protein
MLLVFCYYDYNTVLALTESDARFANRKMKMRLTHSITGTTYDTVFALIEFLQ